MVQESQCLLSMHTPVKYKPPIVPRLRKLYIQHLPLIVLIANRDFFQFKTEQAKVILELFNKEDITQEITEEIDNALTSEDKSASAKINSSRRPPLNYFEMRMKKGGILISTKKKSQYNY